MHVLTWFRSKYFYTHTTFLSSLPSPHTLPTPFPTQANTMLKRRYYLMQRARDALIVGILAGTMAAAGYTEALTRENSYSIHLRNLHTKY